MIAPIFFLESNTFVGISPPAASWDMCHFIRAAIWCNGLYTRPPTHFAFLQWDTINVECGSILFTPLFSLNLHSGTDTTTILSKLPSSRSSSVLTRLRVRPLMNQWSIPDRGTYLFFPTSRTALRPIKPTINGSWGLFPEDDVARAWR